MRQDQDARSGDNEEVHTAFAKEGNIKKVTTIDNPPPVVLNEMAAAEVTDVGFEIEIDHGAYYPPANSSIRVKEV